MRSRLCIVSALVAVGLLAGCASEREPINRVQPNALPKSFFVGQDLQSSKDDPEFYSRAQMIDVGYGASQDGLFTSSWGTAEMARVKFVIQENLLVARLAYERVAGSDRKGVGRESTDGTIVAMYAIESHFDIKREYNPSTGEELNVVGENTSDRPWNEREYMRVDFSKNLNVDSYDFDTLSLIGMFGGVEYEPLAYYVNDPNAEDAPHFDEEGGYFDVTTKAFARPQMLDLSYLGWGIDTFPACFLEADIGGGSYPAASCSPVELTVRQAFRRVTDTDFEPKEWDGQRFQAFGGFYKERFGFTRAYGMSDDKWHRLLSHYNVYERNHYYTDPENMEGAVQCYVPATTPAGADPHRDLDKDGTEDECAAVTAALGVGGSRCNTFNQKCTLPLRKRELKPLVWYTSTGSNPEAYEGTEWATQDWDVALRAAIQSGRYAECVAADKRTDCSVPFEACKAAAEAEMLAEAPRLQPGAACTDDAACVTGACVCPPGKPGCVETDKVCKACEDDFDACMVPLATKCQQEYPIFKGQMDDIQEAVRLAQEVDDCRNGLPAYAADRAADPECKNLADRLGSERGLDAGVIAVAKMPEMIVLCHSPVEQGDHPLCAPENERLPADLTSEMCFHARLEKDTDTLARCNAARNVRMGDIRYHMVNNLYAPQDPSSWGIMLDSNDPLTGETVSASINVWTHVTDLWSQSVVDLARLIKGEITPEEVTDGLYIKQWAQATETGGVGGGAATSYGQGGAVPGFTAEQVAQTTRGAASNIGVNRISGERHPRFTAEVRRKLDKRLRELSGKVRFDAQATASSAPYYEQNRKTFAGTQVEAALTTQAMKQYAGVKAEKVDTGTMTTLASPFRGASPALQREIRQRKELALAQRGACVLNEAPAPLANAQLADLLEEKFGHFNRDDSITTQFRRLEKMRRYIAAKAQHSVIVHEMGHSMGLRHNFVSSSDAYLFRPQYWQLRTKDGTVDKLCVQNCIKDADCTRPKNSELKCSDKNPCIFPNDKCMAMDGYAGNICVEVGSEGDPDVPRETLVSEAEAESCVGPRYFDPTTETERKNLIWMWMQSSIMDYAGESTQDFIGLGVYDFAAARLFYGNSVAVLAEPQYRFNAGDAKGSAKARSLLGHMDNFGGIVGIRWDDYQTSDYGRFFHYSQLQKQMNVISDCAPVDDVNKYKPARWDNDKYGKWSPLLDGLFVAPANDGEYTRCKTPKVEYVPWTSLRLPDGKIVDDSWETSFGDYYRGGPSVYPQGRVRVPYGFATDRWADLGNLSVYRHDNGADAYELFDFLITQQETSHIFTNYRRGRQSFSVRVAADRAMWRYNEKMRDGAKGLGLLANVYRDLALELGYPFPYLWPDVAEYQFRDVLLASSIAFDFFTRLADRPASGLHHNHRRLTDGVARSSLDTSATPPMTIVGIPDGAYGIGAGARTGANGSWLNVGFGGRLLENRLAPDSRGEYSSEYTMNCGSYYDKAWVPMLLTESVDNFISDSRRDFVDPRYRSVSMADLFPEGYRRWLANNLTNDDAIKGPRVFGPSGRPVVELAESPTGLSKVCASDADCGTGNTCCKNPKMVAVSSPERLKGYDKGMCVSGTACPQSCGFERTYVSDPEEDPPCPAGLTCCQGMCSAGSCFVDPSRGIGLTSWLPSGGPTTCFWDERGLKVPSSPAQQACSGAASPSIEDCANGADDDGNGKIDCADPACFSSSDCTVPLDPQVGWEQQKFLIAMTMQYLPENQMRNWIDMMTVWELGLDSDPRAKMSTGEPDHSFLELHDPQGRIYLAKRYGTEPIFGKTVERGVAARVLEYANKLLKDAYDCEEGPDLDGSGEPDWYIPKLAGGQPVVRCDWEQVGMCDCEGSSACVEFQRYMSVPAFMRQVMMTYRQGNPGMKGIY